MERATAVSLEREDSAADAIIYPFFAFVIHNETALRLLLPGTFLVSATPTVLPYTLVPIPQ